jgi:hypothetical protein
MDESLAQQLERLLRSIDEREALHLGRLARQFFLGLLGCPRHFPPQPQPEPGTAYFNLMFSPELRPGQPSPTGDVYMAKVAIGNRRTFTPTFLKNDGTPGQIDGPYTVTTDNDDAVGFGKDDAGKDYVEGLAEGSGSVVVTGDGDLGDGVREIVLMGAVVVYDASQGAVSGDIVFDEGEIPPA